MLQGKTVFVNYWAWIFRSFVARSFAGYQTITQQTWIHPMHKSVHYSIHYVFTNDKHVFKETMEIIRCSLRPNVHGVGLPLVTSNTIQINFVISRNEKSHFVRPVRFQQNMCPNEQLYPAWFSRYRFKVIYSNWFKKCRRFKTLKDRRRPFNVVSTC